MKTELEIANERILELEEQVKKLTPNTVLADSLHKRGEMYLPEKKWCDECEHKTYRCLDGSCDGVW